MMRHVSVFRVKPEYRKEETLEMLRQQLLELPGKIPAITACEIGVKPLEMPTESPDGHVRFFDLIQIITFPTPEDCAAYPASRGHQEFLAESSRYMEEVIGIDYMVTG